MFLVPSGSHRVNRTSSGIHQRSNSETFRDVNEHLPSVALWEDLRQGSPSPVLQRYHPAPFSFSNKPEPDECLVPFDSGVLEQGCI
ncbi:hypothetical protein AMECASPLE_021273 [Ameca splendens]|uniref:Uncharacterized protein n=1 Tax=Ameca splendens TaxID=208324 RepID=A0ABV0Z2Q4_9TELE